MYAVQTAKPQIIVLDSDAPFISVSKFVSMLRENDVNCVLILLEGSDARHEPCPGIAAIRLDRNDLSPQRVQDAFRHAIAMADSRSAIRLTVSSPHQMPDDLLAYLQSGGPLTPAPRAAVPPDAVGQLLSDGPCFPDAGLRPAAPVLLLLLHGKAALSLLSLPRERDRAAPAREQACPSAAHWGRPRELARRCATFLSDYATEPPQLPQATLQPLITDIYPLSEVSRAYHAQESGASIRNIIHL